jgi:hypothetical protein
MSDAVGGDAALAAIKAGGGGGTSRAIEVGSHSCPGGRRDRRSIERAVKAR